VKGVEGAGAVTASEHSTCGKVVYGETPGVELHRALVVTSEATNREEGMSQSRSNKDVVRAEVGCRSCSSRSPRRSRPRRPGRAQRRARGGGPEARDGDGASRNAGRRRPAEEGRPAQGADRRLRARQDLWVGAARGEKERATGCAQVGAWGRGSRAGRALGRGGWLPGARRAAGLLGSGGGWRAAGLLGRALGRGGWLPGARRAAGLLGSGGGWRAAGLLGGGGGWRGEKKKKLQWLWYHVGM
jgi:hypothetical protein